MNLESQDIERVNRARDFILKTSASELLKKLKCRKCRGTGLWNVSYTPDGEWTGWDCNTYCDYCKGIGYINPAEFDTTLYKCNRCDGDGVVDNPDHNKHGWENRTTECKHCQGFGFVNWIENLFGKTYDRNISG